MAPSSNTPTRDASVTAWKRANVAIFVVVLMVNALGATGRMSGSSIGVIANRAPSYFLPADYVFGIWSLIYAGLLAATVYQVLPTARAADVVRRIGPWWLVTNTLNAAWVTLFSFSLFGAALVVMVVLLLALIALNEHVLALGARVSLVERLCVTYPIGIYFAWISVALIANSFQYAHIVGFGGLGITEPVWSLVMMVVATLLGWVMVATRRMWVFPLVVAWAIRGIGDRWPDVALVSDAARIVAPLSVAGGALALLVSWRRAGARAGA